MSMRIYLSERALYNQKLIELDYPNVQQAATKVNSRLDTCSLQPYDWKGCHLASSKQKLHFCDETGQPYIEFRHFRTLLTPPEPFCSLETEEIITRVLIVDSWTGNQPAACLTGMEDYIIDQWIRLSLNINAVLTRHGEAVNVEISFIGDKVSPALWYYELIRKQPQTFCFPKDRRATSIHYLDGCKPQA